MADARPTLSLPQRYTQAQTETVQPPDDRTYSAEVTSFPSNLPHHRNAHLEKSADSPYTRLINIPPLHAFVKHNFTKIQEKSQNCRGIFVRFAEIALPVPNSKICKLSAPGRQNRALVAHLPHSLRIRCSTAQAALSISSGPLISPFSAAQ